MVPIGDVVARRHVTIPGQVMRMRARPIGGPPSLSVAVSDGTGSATVVWTGRREIGGITLGRRLELSGVASLNGRHLEFANPRYVLLPPL